MYQDTLSLTAENVLGFLTGELENEFSIREIAKSIGQDYKIVFNTMIQLKKRELVHVRRVSNINRCSALLSPENAAVYGFVAERCSAKKLAMQLYSALREIPAATANPFYSMLVFGSYAKGTARKGSDIDVMFVTACKDQETEIEAAVNRTETLNAIKVHPVVLTAKEFKKGIVDESVAREAIRKHLIIAGGEQFFALIAK
jgi:predicted nucleotidyltransferase